MAEIFKVLFLCNDNSCRSPMAQAIMNAYGRERFLAFSAGPRPSGQIHSKALEILHKKGIDPSDLMSKSWNRYSTTRFELVITLCAETAEETYPVFPGRPQRLHWIIPNPLQASEVQGEDVAFEAVFAKLKERIQSVIDVHST